MKGGSKRNQGGEGKEIAGNEKSRFSMHQEQKLKRSWKNCSWG